jgi:hypothetical protein
MTRKDYILIAAAFKRAREHVGVDFGADRALQGIEEAAVVLSGELARDNPRFDRERFLKAAGVQS